MGCIHSKNELLYRVYVNDAPGNLEINAKEIILYQKNREPTKWMLQHLRRYGFDAETEIFTFEAGRRCPTGEGIYTFRCNRAESLFHLLQSYIQQSDMSQQQQNSINVMGANEQNLRSRSTLHTSHSSNLNNGNNNSNYIIPSSIRPVSQYGTITTFSNSSDTLNSEQEENNYLEPTPAMRNALLQQQQQRIGLRLNSIDSGQVNVPLSPIEPHSPSSPSSLNRILEVTQLNEPQHQPPFQNSNLYQEYPIKSENNNNEFNRKLSLDIPPQEHAPTIQQHKYESPSHQTLSPLSPQDRTYVNIKPGEIGTPTASTSMYFPRTSTPIDASMRCYENLEPGEIRSHLIHQQQVQSPTGGPQLNAAAVILQRNARYSKPDIFAKIDLPMSSSFDKSSEPSTPTSLKIQQQKTNCKESQEQHKVNYIVLDLDSATNNVDDSVDSQKMTISQNTLNNNNNNNISSNTSNNALNKLLTTTTTITSTTPNSKLSNGSILAPDNTAINLQTLGYATIDFNKTAALQNSTSTAADSDGSCRKTRHSASRQSNSISE